MISLEKDRAVTRSGEAYSTLAPGVYATKPGVLLTEEHIDHSLEDKVPMGVTGVIPTKVCIEGGAIQRRSVRYCVNNLTRMVVLSPSAEMYFANMVFFV